MTPLFGTGAFPSRPIRSSQLIFGWESRYLGLDAYTGQVGRFLVVTPVARNTITGKNGSAVTAGLAQPRFEQISGQGNIPRLSVIADDGAKDVERTEWDHLLGVMALSIYVRAWPLYTPGQSLGGGARPLIAVGNATTGGGSYAIQRSAAKWQAVRVRGATTTLSELTEPGTATFGIDVLATLSLAGGIQLWYRDAALDLRNGSLVTDANMAIPTESWAGNILYLSGGAYRYETIKVARGVQTFAQIDALH